MSWCHLWSSFFLATLDLNIIMCLSVMVLKTVWNLTCGWSNKKWLITLIKTFCTVFFVCLLINMPCNQLAHHFVSFFFPSLSPFPSCYFLKNKQMNVAKCILTSSCSPISALSKWPLNTFSYVAVSFFFSLSLSHPLL